MSLLKKASVMNDEDLEELSEGSVSSDEVSTAIVQKGDRLSIASDMAKHHFGIGDDYYITGFKDTGKTLTMSFSNPQFEVTIKVKEAEGLV